MILALALLVLILGVVLTAFFSIRGDGHEDEATKKAVAGFGLLVALCISIGMLFYTYFLFRSS